MSASKRNNKRRAVRSKTAQRKPRPAESATRPFYVVCIGASAGGLNAVMELVSQFTPRINAAIFIVLHFSSGALGQILVDRIRRDCALPCLLAKANELIKPGHIYVCAPDSHLMVKDRIVLGKGPPENRFRPSIDVLFRSAAVHYDGRTIGVVLTGMLNDGTAGMWAISQSGGYCIVQDPDEAEYPDMPLSVIQAVKVDEVLRLDKMGAAIEGITKAGAKSQTIAPPLVVAEAKLSEKAATGFEKVTKVGHQMPYSCPDCGGSLFSVEGGKLVHYRCYIGHSYSEDDLLLKQSQNIEHTLWVAVRMMEERKLLFEGIARTHGAKGFQKWAENYTEQGEDLGVHVERLKTMLFNLQKE
jgi:two-component system chemotaxis response regulator CheB